MVDKILETLSLALPEYHIKQVTQQDYNAVYHLCLGNHQYYQYELGHDVTYDEVVECILEYPPNTPPGRKHFVGIYDGQKLIAVFDYLAGYQEETLVWIGLFILQDNLQQKGLGTKIIAVFKQAVKECGYQTIRLACLEDNQEGLQFWIKNQFIKVSRKVSKQEGRKDWHLVVMEYKV